MEKAAIIERSRVIPYLQLARFPNIFTAVADVLAGYLIVAGFQVRWTALLGLMTASSAIYAAGCVLNDYMDRETDALERPFRPIPSGRISPRRAFSIALILFSLGLFGASLAGPAPFWTALLLVGFVVGYDARAKKRSVEGPLTMGLCRSTNLVLGMSPAFGQGGIHWLFPVITLGYVFGLTALSRYEVSGGLGFRKWLILALWILTIGAIIGMNTIGVLRTPSLIYLGILILWTGPMLAYGLFKVSPAHIGRAVKYLILGIPVLDAVYVSGIHGFAMGLLVMFCLVPAWLFSRFLYVT